MTTLTQDDATIAYRQRIDRYFYMTAIVLLGYDYLLTLESEVRYIWIYVFYFSFSSGPDASVFFALTLTFAVLYTPCNRLVGLK
ncbi:hypothetical protein B0H14DRAFT_2894777 [Mycena olivaceomarginata]|nr:hypothetical protein B0H14DRAFT_2894777 [Mycena olivaceomarginata]